MGDETSAKVLYGLLAEYPTFRAAAALGLNRRLLCADDVRLDFKHLDRGRCYTFGFRHPNFHPMTANPPGVWIIQTVNVTIGGFRADGLPGIPLQATYSREDIIRLAADAGLRDIGPRGLRMEDLEIISLRALDEAKAAIAREITLPARLKETPFNYGFILRSRGPGANSNVLCARAASPSPDPPARLQPPAAANP